jgi:hypothetical protein
MEIEQYHELVENPSYFFISVHSVVVSVLDRGMFAVHSSPTCIRSHGSNPALAKKFNRGHWNCQWKNSTPPFSHIARGVYVRVCVNPQPFCTIGGWCRPFWSIFVESSEVRRSLGCFLPFSQVENGRPITACAHPDFQTSGLPDRYTNKAPPSFRPFLFIS